MKNNSDFSLHNKTEIYYNQYHNKLKSLESIPITHFTSHLNIAKSFPKYNGLTVCPFCINCYIHPGKQVITEINKRYGLQIDDNPNIFNNKEIRPGEFEFVVPQSQGGTNSIQNGVFICSQCYKQKSNVSLKDFFNIFFNCDNQRYYKKPQTINSTFECMDLDLFDRKCFFCKLSSDYKICLFCAGKKNQIISIAT